MVFRERINQFISSIKTINNKDLSIFKFLLKNPSIQSLQYIRDILKQNLLTAEKWIEESKKYNDYFQNVPDYPLHIMSNNDKDIYLGKMNDEKGFYIVNKNNYFEGYFIPFGSIDIKDLTGKPLDSTESNKYASYVFLDVNPFLIDNVYHKTNNIMNFLNKIIDILDGNDNDTVSFEDKLHKVLTANHEMTINTDEENLMKKNYQYTQMIEMLNEIDKNISFFEKKHLNNKIFVSSLLMTQADKLDVRYDEYKQRYEKAQNLKNKLHINYQHIPDKIDINDIDKYSQDIVEQLNKQLNLNIKVRNKIKKDSMNILFNGYYDPLTDVIGLHLDINSSVKKIDKNVFLHILLHEYGHALYLKERYLQVQLAYMFVWKACFLFYQKDKQKQEALNFIDRTKIFIQFIKNVNILKHYAKIVNKIYNTTRVNMERFADNFSIDLMGEQNYIKGSIIMNKINNIFNDNSVFKFFKLLPMSNLFLTTLEIFKKVKYLNNIDNNNLIDIQKDFAELSKNNKFETSYDLKTTHPNEKERIGGPIISVFASLNKNNSQQTTTNMNKIKK